ncbi:MAG: opacity protein-like surface antigen [Flammeovirgaceae bacterium]
MAHQSETLNGFSNKSNFNFNRKFLTVGALQLIPFSETNTVRGLLLGAGMNYNLPGALKRTENEVSFGVAEYKSKVGFHVDLGLKLAFDDQISLYTGLRYRHLQLELDSYTEGDVNSLPKYIVDLNASGIEVSVTLAKSFGSNK